MMMQAVVPPGAEPGSQFEIETGQGRMMLTVPPGHVPGQAFQFQLPPASQVPQAVSAELGGSAPLYPSVAPMAPVVAPSAAAVVMAPVPVVPVVTGQAVVGQQPATGMPVVGGQQQSILNPDGYRAVNGQPRRAWRAPLLECAQDGSLCMSSWCCNFIFVPQMYERVMGEPGSCQKWAIGLASLFAAYVFCWTLSASPFFAVVANLVMIAYVVLVVHLGLTARKRVRMADQIPAVCCGDAEDCCCAYWCSCCASIQIMRHTGVPDGAYSFTSPTGTPPGVPPVYPGGQ